MRLFDVALGPAPENHTTMTYDDIKPYPATPVASIISQDEYSIEKVNTGSGDKKPPFTTAAASIDSQEDQKIEQITFRSQTMLSNCSNSDDIEDKTARFKP